MREPETLDSYYEDVIKNLRDDAERLMLKAKDVEELQSRTQEEYVAACNRAADPMQSTYAKSSLKKATQLLKDVDTLDTARVHIANSAYAKRIEATKLQKEQERAQEKKHREAAIAKYQALTEKGK